MDTTTLKSEITSHVRNLAALTTEAARSEVMKKYLETCAKFHCYSACNQMLIMLSHPDASQVAGFVTWKKLNRFVRRGEKGIPILAPCVYKKDPDSEESPKVVKGFRVVYVFDISQTDGEDLPPEPDWKSPQKNLELQDHLIKFAESRQVQVWTREQRGEVQGSSAGGVIELSPEAGTKTLIHELAHELLHHGPDKFELTRQNKELEAEAVAFVVASHFGLADLASPNYLALWDADSNKILERMDRIRDTATEIIRGVEPEDELTD